MHKIVALYKFCRITELKYFQNIIKAQLSSLNILGTIIIGEEGINGTISGTEDSLLKATSFLQSIDQFQGIDLKESSSAKKPFLRLKIKIKDEIVSMGLKNIDPTTQAGQYIDPKDWNSLIDNKDTILIDTRNDYEYSIGSFENSINPETKNFKEFPNWVDKQEFSKSDKKSKNVAMFCTGGIRCEKASSYMKKQGFKNVYHLKAGILKYLENLMLMNLNGKENALSLMIEFQLNMIYQKVNMICAMVVEPLLQSKTNYPVITSKESLVITVLTAKLQNK